MMRRRIANILLLLCLALFAGPAYSQVSPNQIDAVFASLKFNAAPGAAALVVHNGRAVFHREYGVTDLRTLHKIDGHTNFRLASFTKQFTATITSPTFSPSFPSMASPSPSAIC
jgi:CubicO group peptidase (beta-lactamase class C family)